MSIFLAIALAISGATTPIPANTPRLELRAIPMMSEDASLRLVLDTDLGGPGMALDDIGRVIENGLSFGYVSLGVEGVPEGPFISTYYYSREIRFTGVSPEAVASSVMAHAEIRF